MDKENLYEILSKIPHNRHYLLKYVNFIYSCQQLDFSSCIYAENHHICPKAKEMFPELTNEKWNIVRLPYRHHVIAHIFLYKAFKNDSMTTSLLFTTKQKHAKDLSISKINTKIIEEAKINLSKLRKGKRTHNFSESCRKKLSEKKSEFYKNPKNRLMHSIACTGSKRINKKNIELASLNRSTEHQEKLNKSIKSSWSNKIQNGYKVIPKFLYLTPYGIRSNVGKYREYCKNPDKPISIHSTKGSNSAFPKSCIGRTPRELGFSLIEKSNPEYERFHALLDQVHQLSSNHVLWSLLDDFPLREKLHSQR
jgi:hypothetical protein